jgi:hypothetical protein
LARAFEPSPSQEGGHPAPGAVSRLLGELAEAPPTDVGDGWKKWLASGVVVGRFELVREIGRGGFGVVWEAVDRESGRRVAFKAVRPGGKGGVREARLLQEAEVSARLSHPGIVSLLDVGRSSHGPYLVLELLRGWTPCCPRRRCESARPLQRQWPTPTPTESSTAT